MGGARDRQLLLGKIGRGLGEQERLQRLSRRPQERDQVGVAVGIDDLAVVNRYRVDAVRRLDDSPSFHGYCERVHSGTYA